MQITIFTSITDGTDELRDDFLKSNAKYIAFLDDDSRIESVGNDLWECRPCYNKFQETRRNAKIHKIIPHKFIGFKEDDVSIWLDGNISLNITPKELVKLWLKDKDIAVCKHFERKCIYEEADACIECQLDDPVLIRQQMKRYRKVGYVKNQGLAECGIIIRRHTKEINKLSEQWWEEIKLGSSRDQLSFNYVFKDYNQVDANARYNPLFNYNLHLKSSNNDYAKYYV